MLLCYNYKKVCTQTFFTTKQYKIKLVNLKKCKLGLDKSNIALHLVCTLDPEIWSSHRCKIYQFLVMQFFKFCSILKIS